MSELRVFRPLGLLSGAGTCALRYALHGMWNPDDSGRYQNRVTAFELLLGLLFAAVTLAYWRVQVIQGPEYAKEAENNRIRLLVLPAPRGIILDRDGRPLVDNRASFDAVVVREELEDRGATVRRAARLLDLPNAAVADYRRRAAGTTAFRPVTLKADLTMRELSVLGSRRELLRGVSIAREPRRSYSGGSLFGHLAGYVGEVSERELRSRRYRERLHPGDMFGRSGLEAYYNDELIGYPGETTIIVDSHGRKHGETGTRRVPVAGRILVTSLDADLQGAAGKAFDEEGKSGAAVVLDPRTGEILALLSVPSYDSNLFSVHIPLADWRRLQNDPDHPMQNRAVQSRYPPGSTFKPIEAVAGLAEGILQTDSVKLCRGSAEFFGRRFHCWKKGGHGSIPLKTAIEKSCNVYFYKVGNQLRIDRIAKYGALFGLGKKTGIDLPGDNPGILPSDAWKRKTLHERWYPGETISVSIGQGFLQVTPLQLAVAYAALANGGTVYRPHIVREIREADGTLVRRIEPEVRSRVPMTQEIQSFIKEALYAVVNGHGTARRARIDGFDVCGKTGTAQVTRASAGTDAEKLAAANKDHAWFAGFAPRDKPEIAFCIFVEHGGHGGLHSAPIARKILEAYLAKKNKART